MPTVYRKYLHTNVHSCYAHPEHVGPDIDSPERTRKSDMYSWATEYKQQQKELSEQQQPQAHLEADHTHLHEDHASFKKSVLRSEEQVSATASSISSDQHRTEASPAKLESGDGERSRVCAEEDKDSRKSGCGMSGGVSTEVQRHVTVQGRTYETYKTVC